MQVDATPQNSTAFDQFASQVNLNSESCFMADYEDGSYSYNILKLQLRHWSFCIVLVFNYFSNYNELLPFQES